VHIENAGSDVIASAPFAPRSITERATALGGSARVERHALNDTVVVVEIPL
jgi:hypothetical protein